jgi:hypothetical protein
VLTERDQISSECLQALAIRQIADYPFKLGQLIRIQMIYVGQQQV